MELSKHSVTHNRTVEQDYWEHTQTREAAIWIIPLCQKSVKTSIDQHNWTNLRGIAKNESTSFNNVNVIQIMDYLYTPYDKVDHIELENNQVTIMTVYTPDIPMAIIANQLVEGRNFSQTNK